MTTNPTDCPRARFVRHTLTFRIRAHGKNIAAAEAAVIADLNRVDVESLDANDARTIAIAALLSGSVAIVQAARAANLRAPIVRGVSIDSSRSPSVLDEGVPINAWNGTVAHPDVGRFWMEITMCEPKQGFRAMTEAVLPGISATKATNTLITSLLMADELWTKPADLDQVITMANMLSDGYVLDIPLALQEGLFARVAAITTPEERFDLLYAYPPDGFQMLAIALHESPALMIQVLFARGAYHRGNTTFSAHAAAAAVHGMPTRAIVRTLMSCGEPSNLARIAILHAITGFPLEDHNRAALAEHGYLPS